MDRVVILTSRVATTGKPYSQAIAYGGVLYVSGQVALDPATGTVVQGFEAQTRRVLDNLTEILEAGGTSRSLVLKTTCFLTDVADAATFNEIYREYFRTDPPARSTVIVADLSAGFRVEVDAIAALPESPGGSGLV